MSDLSWLDRQDGRRDPAGELGTTEADLDNNEATSNVWPDYAPDIHGLIAFARGLGIIVYGLSLFTIGFLMGWLAWG